ncbi:glycosyltransferase family 4 protein [Alkalibacterium sp. f15]|uniref:glycosyltransferase family 4 protein n=1 Tax=Alkalibacterium sp. f15 TaxID=3414029 RepID=UPI003BF8ABBD
MTKVLHINSNFLTSKLHENLIDKLPDMFENVIFMPIKKAKHSEMIYTSKYEVYSPVTFNEYHKFFYTWKQFKIYSKLKSLIDVREYDVIHAHTLFTDGNIAFKLFKKYDIPYIVTVRNDTDVENFFKIRINLRGRGINILKNASEIIFLSESSKLNLCNKYIKNEETKVMVLEKSHIIPNGIDDFWHKNKAAARRLDENKQLKLLSVGQIRKRKNQIGSIKAAQILKSKYNKDVKLTFVGKVIEKEYLDKMNKQNNQEMEVIEHIEKEGLIDLYKNNDIFILPSFRETFGLVYPEAMSQGLPVIYSKEQGFHRQFEEGIVGYGVDSENPEDIADKIIKIIDNYDEISLNALTQVDKFDWDILSDELGQLYCKVIDKNNMQ